MNKEDIISLIDKEIDISLAIKDLMSKQIKHSLTSLSGQSSSLIAAPQEPAPSWAKTSSSHAILNSAQDLVKFESQIRTIDLVIQSLNKVKSQILLDNNSQATVAVSGGFDPIHIGHVRMIQEASKLGMLTVIVNSDDWLKRKKGYSFMSEDERVEIISSIDGVSNVIVASDEDNTVCKTLKGIRPDIFANGGDRTNKNTPEKSLCKELGIKMVWGIGGKKIQSSSELVKKTASDKGS